MWRTTEVLRSVCVSPPVVTTVSVTTTARFGCHEVVRSLLKLKCLRAHSPVSALPEFGAIQPPVSVQTTTEAVALLLALRALPTCDHHNKYTTGAFLRPPPVLFLCFGVRRRIGGASDGGARLAAFLAEHGQETQEAAALFLRELSENNRRRHDNLPVGPLEESM